MFKLPILSGLRGPHGLTGQRAERAGARAAAAVTLAALALSIAGCGQKGPLFLPAPPTATSGTAPSVSATASAEKPSAAEALR